MNSKPIRTVYMTQHFALSGVLFMLLLLALSRPVEATQGDPLFLVLEAPQTIELGQPLELIVKAENAENFGGYQTNLLFDRAAAEFGGLRQRDNGVVRQGRDIHPVGPHDIANGVAFGFYSCPAASCVDDDSRQWVDAGARGEIELSRVVLLPRQEGLHEISLAGVQVVDAAGQPIAVDLSRAVIKVQVGKANTPFVAASGAAEPAADPPLLGRAAPAPDLSGDGWVTHADVMEVAVAWEEAYLVSGTACGGAYEARLDISGNGCLGISDMQRVAAQYSRDVPLLGERGANGTDTIFVVNSVGDGADSSLGNGICATQAGDCTLRAALGEARARAGNHRINFNIPGTGPHNILLTSALPLLSRTDSTLLVDGYSQPGASPNTDPAVSNAVIKVQIEGAGSAAHRGFGITGSNVTIQGLAMYRLNRNILLYSASARDNRIIGNFIGTNAAGTHSSAFSGGRPNGIQIEQGARSNQIGDTAPAERNVISGGARTGCGSWHEGTNNNVIYNNIVGLTPDGSGALPNKQHGIDVNFGASFNIIGGTAAGMRNVVAGNKVSGIEISHEAGTNDNHVIGNYVGVDVDGRARSYTHNDLHGIVVKDRVTNNYVAYNLVGASLDGGINVDEYGSCCLHDNRFEYNWIGVAPDGSNIANQQFGVRITAGDTTFGPGNVVANNPVGLRIHGQATFDYNRITANSFYNNAGLGIDIGPLDTVNPNDPGDVDTGPNEQMNFPVITLAAPYQLSGTSCPGCTVEAFIADGPANGYGEGKSYLASATADANGQFTVVVNNLPVGTVVTTTATDPAGNTSEFGQNVAVAPGSPPPAPVRTFTPVIDSHVIASFPNNNYGAEWRIGAALSPDRDSYLRFNVSGLEFPVSRATLRLHSFDASTAGVQVRPVSDNNWTESGITYNNAPAMGAVVATSGPVTGGTWTEIDVTPLITGNGTYNIGLTTTGGLLRFVSSEGANPPELVVETTVPSIQP